MSYSLVDKAAQDTFKNNGLTAIEQVNLIAIKIIGGICGIKTYSSGVTDVDVVRVISGAFRDVLQLGAMGAPISQLIRKLPQDKTAITEAALTENNIFMQIRAGNKKHERDGAVSLEAGSEAQEIQDSLRAGATDALPANDTVELTQAEPAVGNPQ